MSVIVEFFKSTILNSPGGNVLCQSKKVLLYMFVLSKKNLIAIGRVISTSHLIGQLVLFYLLINITFGILMYLVSVTILLYHGPTGLGYDFNQFPYEDFSLLVDFFGKDHLSREALPFILVRSKVGQLLNEYHYMFLSSVVVVIFIFVCSVVLRSPRAISRTNSDIAVPKKYCHILNELKEISGANDAKITIGETLISGGCFYISLRHLLMRDKLSFDFVVQHEIYHSITWDTHLTHGAKVLSVLLGILASLSVCLFFIPLGGDLNVYIFLVMIFILGYSVFQLCFFPSRQCIKLKELLADKYAYACFNLSTDKLREVFREDSDKFHPSRNERIKHIEHSITSLPNKLSISLILWFLLMSLAYKFFMQGMGSSNFVTLLFFITLLSPLFLSLLTKAEYPFEKLIPVCFLIFSALLVFNEQIIISVICWHKNIACPLKISEDNVYVFLFCVAAFVCMFIQRRQNQ